MTDKIKNRTVYMLCRTDKTDDDGKDVYVGSTSLPLPRRLQIHKYDAGSPSELKYYGASKLYERMREVGVHRSKIVPLLTFACDQNTIFEFERGWIKALNANLNTISPVNEDLLEREYKTSYFKKNKEDKRYYCGVCDVACKDKFHLNRHLDTLKHSYAWLNSVDSKNCASFFLFFEE